MKHGWEYTSFGDIISPAKNLRNSEGAVLPVLSITMHGGIVKQNERFKKVIASRDTANYKVVKRGQLVIAFPIDEGLIYTQEVADKGIMSPAYNVYDIDCTNINRHFLVTFLHSPFAMKYYKDKLRGTTQRRRMLPKEDLYALSIPLPPLPVQEQICSLLDKMNRVIEAKKEQLKELDNLAQAIFYDMFGDPTVNDKGWEKQKLGDCFSYIKNGANIKQDKSQIGFPITRIETLSNGVFNRDRMGYAGITDKTKYEQYILQDKDLLMSHINSKAYIGRTVLYRKKEGEVFIHGMNLLRLVPLPLLDSVFFCYLAKTDYVKEKIASIRKDAVNQSSFAISDLKKIDIPIPPLPLQQSFAEKVEAIERQKELINQSIKDVQTLFDAKMDYYFGD